MIIDNINEEYKTISILNGEVRRAFVPGEIMEVKEFTGLNDDDQQIIELKAIWNSDIIQQYQDSLDE